MRTRTPYWCQCLGLQEEPCFSSCPCYLLCSLRNSSGAQLGALAKVGRCSKWRKISQTGRRYPPPGVSWALAAMGAHFLTHLFSFTDGAAGSLRRALQPDVTLGADGFFQHCPEAAFPLHLPLLSAPDLQAEGHAVAMLRGHEAHCHLPLHPLLPLRGVQLLGTYLPQQRGDWDAVVGEGSQEVIQGEVDAPSVRLQRGQD